MHDFDYVGAAAGDKFFKFKFKFSSPLLLAAAADPFVTRAIPAARPPDRGLRAARDIWIGNR